MAQIDDYLAHMIASRGSDLHLSSGEPARMRVDGDLITIDETPLPPETIEAVVFEVLEEAQREKLVKEKNLDFAYMVNQELGNFRFNIFYTRKGIAVVARAIPSKIPTIEQLGLPPVIAKLTEAHKGLILVTGPTGSGKSTTLAAMINHINANESGHILTVEDPVEFIHPSKKCLINQRQIGQSVHTFADALKYALREDPDVILVGEMRDLETIALALTAAETGHLVFGTLHTRGAASSIDRIIDSFPSSQQAMVRVMLSESLIAVVSQALLKKADGKGRVAAYEIMVVNAAISNLMREGKTFQIGSAIQTGRREGMILMEQHIKELMKDGLVSQSEGQKYLDELTGATTSNTSSHAPSSTPAAAAKPKSESAQALPKLNPRPPEPKPRVEPAPPAAPAVAPAAPQAPPEGEDFVPMSERTAIAHVPGLATMGKTRKTLPMNAPSAAALPSRLPATRTIPAPLPAPPGGAKPAPPPLGRAPMPAAAPPVAPPPVAPPAMVPPAAPATATATAAAAKPSFVPTFAKPPGAKPLPAEPLPAPPVDYDPSEADMVSGLQVLPTSTNGEDLQSNLVDLGEGEEDEAPPATPTFRPKKTG